MSTKGKSWEDIYSPFKISPEKMKERNKKISEFMKKRCENPENIGFIGQKHTDITKKKIEKIFMIL